MSSSIRIGAATVTAAKATDFLLGRAKRGDNAKSVYNRDTVLFYDYGGDTTATSVRPTPGPISFEDLGRVVCIGGSLTYQRGHELMRRAQVHVIPHLVTSELTEISGPGAPFLAHDDVRAVTSLFAELEALPGLSWGTVGKVLHLKMPAHLPIPDSHFRTAYRGAAVRFHNTHVRRQRERARRTRAPFVSYWGAFHADLLDGKDALTKLRESFQVTGATKGSGVTHEQRLLGLPLARILDALAWGVGSGRLEASVR